MTTPESLVATRRNTTREENNDNHNNNHNNNNTNNTAYTPNNDRSDQLHQEQQHQEQQLRQDFNESWEFPSHQQSFDGSDERSGFAFGNSNANNAAIMSGKSIPQDPTASSISSDNAHPRDDRRKQFDVCTTPTLIDEEDYIAEQERDERLRLDLANLLLKAPGSATNAALVGASAGSVGGGASAHNKSLSEVDDWSAPDDLTIPAAVTNTTLSTAPVVAAVPSLSSSASAETARNRSRTVSSVSMELNSILVASSPSSPRRIGATPTNAGSTATTNRGCSSSHEAAVCASPVSRPPLAPTPPRNADKTQQLEQERQRTFSPNTLRLTEDIGNLLNEDEDDDDYAPPPIIKNNKMLSEFGRAADDWAGSFVAPSLSPPPPLSSSSKTGLPRGTPAKPEGDARRRTGPRSSTMDAGGGGSGGNSNNTGTVSRTEPQHQHQQPNPFQQRPNMANTFLTNAQQPKPIRSGNETFQFPAKPQDREGASQHPAPVPQLVKFGSAFAPPTKDGSGALPTATISTTTTTAPLSSLEQQQPAASPLPFTFGGGGAASSFAVPHATSQSQSFVFAAAGEDPAPIPGTTMANAREAYFRPNRYSTPSPTYGSAQGFPPPPQQQRSEMQATAREFVPMATRSASGPSPPVFSVPAPMQPQLPPPQQQWSQQHPSQRRGYDSPAHEQGSWHAPNSNYAFGASGPNYVYGMPPPSPHTIGGGANGGSGDMGVTRGGLTPSPHLPAWPQQQQAVDSNMYGSNPIPAPIEGMHSPYVFSQGTHIAPASGKAGRKSYPERKKRHSHRGKKGKVKSQKSGDVPSSSAKKSLASTKKKKQGEIPRPGSTAQNQDGIQDENTMSSSEEPVDPKRAELVESPATRMAFKDFYRSFRLEERRSFQKAEEFALHVLEDGSLPESVHWRVFLELADLAKRSNRYVEARRLYAKVCQLQPYASQGWLEYSKLEEECGHMNRVTNVLHAGLEYCEYSENLLTRAVKHQEKMGNLDNARGLMARPKHVRIEKVWRTVLEGALLEARAGNISMARRVLKYLMHHVPWYGPLYLEAYRLERDQNQSMDALQVVKRGLEAIPRYGPLWFGAFRLCEEMDMAKKLYHLPTTMEMIERSILNISKELVWKVHLEAAQMQERSAIEQASKGETNSESDALFAPSRNRFALTIMTCPRNLRWKVWLVAGRMELGLGNTETARALVFRAHQVVPEKGRSATLLERARLEEFMGDTALARAVLCKGRVDYGHDWKVWLEGVMLEIRCGFFGRAIKMVTNALEIHCGTGRLWAAFVHLSQFCGGDAAQDVALRRALKAVPKSGEVWCEGARIHLNPFSDTFDLKRARRHLLFATRFTPQFGDSFVETLRLELLSQWLSPIADFVWEKTKDNFLPANGVVNAEEDRLTKYVTDVSLCISVSCQEESDKDNLPILVYREIVGTLRDRLSRESMRKAIDLSDLRLVCAKADPNYGSLWIRCRRIPTDTPRKVIEYAAEDVADEQHGHARVYLAAMVRRTAILAVAKKEKPPNIQDTIETDDPVTVAWEKCIDEKLRAAPSLKEIFNPLDPTTGSMLLESAISGPDFATGLPELNKHRTLENMSLLDRKKVLFGTDALFP